MAVSRDDVLTYVCVASGPSLTQEQVDYCRGKATVIVINDCYRLAPWADYLYACDSHWWDYHIEEVRKLWQGGEMWTIGGAHVDKYGLRWVEHVQAPGLGTNGKIHTGSNSGFQALNLAILWGAQRVVLLGYDMGFTDEQRTHWFGRHPKGFVNGSPYKQFIAAFETVRTDVPIVNCSAHTYLTCFPRQPLHEALP